MDAHRRRASAWISVPNGRRTLRFLLALGNEEKFLPKPPKVGTSNQTLPPAPKAIERGRPKKGQRQRARTAWIETNSSKRTTSHLLWRLDCRMKHWMTRDSCFLKKKPVKPEKKSKTEKKTRRRTDGRGMPIEKHSNLSSSETALKQTISDMLMNN